MIFSKKALLALVVVIATCAPVLAQERDVELHLRARKTAEEKSSNLNGGNDKIDRRLALSTAVNYPNPCFDLPANRVPDFNPNPANDGWTRALMAGNQVSTGQELPFTFSLHGQSYSTATIHGSGYLSFPVDKFLYGFWSNVDTRDGAGYVWRKTIGTNKLAVAWDNVGYFSRMSDKLNTFQLVISDGTDASMGLGNNVCFCYGDLQWSDSGRRGSTVGTLNFQIGVFDQAGVAYDGGYGNNDGFDFLDNKSVCFKASGSNTPPIAVNVPENNRVDLACGESITNLAIVFLSPEASQSVTLTTSGASAGLTVAISQQPNRATATINWTPTSAATVNVVLTASDGLATTTVSLTFTSPGPCCQGTTAEIWNPITDAFVEPLLNGTTYCLTKYNLRALTCENEPPVVLKLWKTGVNGTTVRRQTEIERPFFLWGNIINATGYNDVQPSPKKQLPNGNYALRINATNPNAYAEIHFTQSCSLP